MEFVKMHGLKNDYIFFLITEETSEDIFKRLTRYPTQKLFF